MARGRRAASDRAAQIQAFASAELRSRGKSRRAALRARARLTAVTFLLEELVAAYEEDPTGPRTRGRVERVEEWLARGKA